MSGIKPVIIIAITLFSLLLLWTQFSSQPVPVDAARKPAQPADGANLISPLLTRIETLESSLREEMSIRQQQEIRINRLEQRLSSTTPNTDDTPIQNHSDTSRAHTQTSTTPVTLQQRLIAASIPSDVAQRFQLRIDQNRLALLQLRDQAIREDWFDSAEYNEQAGKLRNSALDLREEFGDDVYDRYLYAAGRPNRVIVNEVYSGSAAFNAGIEPGDILLSYASSNIYSMSELQQATVAGSAGETVLIEISRKGLPISTSAPRGPLGISMSITRKEP